MERIGNFWTDESGSTATEYALIMALIAGAIILAVTALGISVRGLYEDMAPRVKAP